MTWLTRCVAIALAICLAGQPSWGHTFPPVRKVVLQVEGCEIAVLNDQHAFLRVSPDARLPDGSTLLVGDMIGCAISHPCTTFDKWRFMPIVDDDYNVTDAITTWF